MGTGSIASRSLL